MSNTAKVHSSCKWLHFRTCEFCTQRTCWWRMYATKKLLAHQYWWKVMYYIKMWGDAYRHFYVGIQMEIISNEHLFKILFLANTVLYSFVVIIGIHHNIWGVFVEKFSWNIFNKHAWKIVALLLEAMLYLSRACAMHESFVRKRWRYTELLRLKYSHIYKGMFRGYVPCWMIWWFGPRCCLWRGSAPGASRAPSTPSAPCMSTSHKSSSPLNRFGISAVCCRQRPLLPTHMSNYSFAELPNISLLCESFNWKILFIVYWLLRSSLVKTSVLLKILFFWTWDKYKQQRKNDTGLALV